MFTLNNQFYCLEIFDKSFLNYYIMQQIPLFDALVTFIIIIKVIFIGLIICDNLLLEKIKIVKTPSQKTRTQNREKTIKYWIGRLEFIFVILMSIVLIYLFYPYSKTPLNIDHHTKLLLCLYGFITIFTANWTQFFDTSIIWSTLSHNLI